jgi:hypothetical protein
MLKFLPVGFMGLMVGGLIAANSSTILTHLNWGASYLVHDCYRRFINPSGTEKHYVWAGRCVTVGLFVCAAATTFLLDTAKDAFDLILQIGAGTGLLYLLRWFWWRINAWCEVAAMVSSFAVSVLVFILHKNQIFLNAHFHAGNVSLDLPITVAVTTLCWVLVAYLGPQTELGTLVAFYKKVKPFGPGWRRIRLAAGVSQAEAAATHENIPLALLGWAAGCAVIWSGLFTVGNFLYGRMDLALTLLGVFLAGALTLIYVINKLWTALPSAPGPA